MGDWAYEVVSARTRAVEGGAAERHVEDGAVSGQRAGRLLRRRRRRHHRQQHAALHVRLALHAVEHAQLLQRQVAPIHRLQAWLRNRCTKMMCIDNSSLNVRLLKRTTRSIFY